MSVHCMKRCQLLTPMGFSLWRGIASSGDGGRGGASCTAIV